MSNRNCHVLCVEDEDEVRSFLLSELKEVSPKVEVTFATCRDDAVAMFEGNHFFDFITLDLTIPTEAGSFEKSSKNGLAVLGAATSLSPGTPILILTGTSTPEMIAEFLRNSNNLDIWSSGDSRPTVSHLTKSNIAKLPLEIAPRVAAILALSEVELSYTFEQLPLPHDRLFRIFAKKFNAVVVNINVIGGGYSDAKVYSLELHDARGVQLHRCVAKCGERTEIDVDAQNFDTYVGRLEPEATPRKLDHLRYGASDSSAVFYGLASSYPDSFFSACDKGLITPQIHSSLVSILSNWHDHPVQERKQIRDIRRSLLSDKHFDKLVEEYDLGKVLDFEDNYLQCNISCIHGDLHGENILVSTEKSGSTLIDYGDVMTGCSILDPLTLECSFLFHAKSPGSSWPSIDTLNKWSSLEEYLEGCPYSDDIRFCRQWITRLGVSNRELAACLYSYSLRQLKYRDTDKDRALTLINVAFDLYGKT